METQDRSDDELSVLIVKLELSGPQRRPGPELAREAADLLLLWPSAVSPGLSCPPGEQDRLYTAYPEGLPYGYNKTSPVHAAQCVLLGESVPSPYTPVSYFTSPAQSPSNLSPTPNNPAYHTADQTFAISLLPVSTHGYPSTPAATDNDPLQPSPADSSRLPYSTSRISNDALIDNRHSQSLEDYRNPRYKNIPLASGSSSQSPCRNICTPGSSAISTSNNLQRYASQSSLESSHHQPLPTPNASVNTSGTSSQFWNANDEANPLYPSLAPSLRSAASDPFIPDCSSRTATRSGSSPLGVAQVTAQISNSPNTNMFEHSATNPWSPVHTRLEAPSPRLSFYARASESPGRASYVDSRVYSLDIRRPRFQAPSRRTEGPVDQPS